VFVHLSYPSYASYAFTRSASLWACRAEALARAGPFGPSSPPQKKTIQKPIHPPPKKPQKIAKTPISLRNPLRHNDLQPKNIFQKSCQKTYRRF
jgi:hypothetical protein